MRQVKLVGGWRYELLRKARIVMMLSLGCPLTACVGSMPSVEAGNTSPILQLSAPMSQPDNRLAADCADPIELPDRDLKSGEVERLWGQDRANLASCGERHEKTLRFYRTRDGKLAGGR